MKKFALPFFSIYILFCCSSCITPFARSLFLNQNVYKTKDSIDIKKVYDRITGQSINDTTVYRLKLNGNYSFIRYVVLTDSDGSYIRLLPNLYFDSLAVRNLVPNAVASIVPLSVDQVVTYNPTRYYYKIKNDKPTPSQKYLATQHITGLPITIPVKYRFKTPSNLAPFSTNIAISYAFGYKVRIGNNPYHENYMRLLVATGIGTDSYTPSDSIASTTYKSEVNVTWNYAAGITYEAGARFNFGLFYGADKMFGNKRDWYFQGKTWLGLGFGYKFN